MGLAPGTQIPAWLDAVVARALAHDRAARFADVAAMREALVAGAGQPVRRGFLRRILGR